MKMAALLPSWKWPPFSHRQDGRRLGTHVSARGRPRAPRLPSSPSY